jgi:hypothetical protein
MSKRNLRFESGAAGPSNQEIAVVAYSLFEAAGKLDGHDLEHWLRAKDILSHGCSAGNESQKDALLGIGETIATPRLPAPDDLATVSQTGIIE